ncbi:MAG: hypothetical protein E2O74_05215 [Chloroflexi bacterium]|nr:MAG: hypothetical protein E2O74_05215 [Chloroflexota bacterium]
MSDAEAWGWAGLFLLGAYHGVNPAMGWLFAVALGMQEKSGRAVGRALVPIALGHGVAIALVVVLAGLLQIVLPLGYLKLLVAFLLFAFGLYVLIRRRHPRWGGMQVGFRDLTIWSFLMATAHGAGFMVLPVLLGMSAGASAGHAASGPDLPLSTLGGPLTTALAVVVHTGGYLLVTGVVAWIIYWKLGLALLRTAWLNLDLVWAVALMATGCFTLLL